MKVKIASAAVFAALLVATSAAAQPPYPSPPQPSGQHVAGQGGSAEVPPYPLPYPSAAEAQSLLDSAVVRSETVQPPIAVTSAPASGTRRCYNGSWTRSWLEVAGAKIGQVEEDQKGFCAMSGHRIDKDYGWHGQSWSWGPWCITNYDSYHAWKDIPFSKQGTATGSVGVQYPWGCGGVRTIHATHIITASGRTYGKW